MFNVRFSNSTPTRPGVEKIDVEIADVEALAAKYPDVANNLRAFSRWRMRLAIANSFGARNSMQLFNFFEQIVSARRRNQHARRMRYPKDAT